MPFYQNYVLVGKHVNPAEASVGWIDSASLFLRTGGSGGLAIRRLKRGPLLDEGGLPYHCREERCGVTCVLVIGDR